MQVPRDTADNSSCLAPNRQNSKEGELQLRKKINEIIDNLDTRQKILHTLSQNQNNSAQGLAHWINSISIPCELVRNANSWVPSKTYWIRNFGGGSTGHYLTSPMFEQGVLMKAKAGTVVENICLLFDFPCLSWLWPRFWLEEYLLYDSIMKFKNREKMNLRNRNQKGYSGGSIINWLGRKDGAFGVRPFHILSTQVYTCVNTTKPCTSDFCTFKEM